MNNLNVKFCGASRGVTGSCFLLEGDKWKILIDCGLFQGKEDEYLNYEEFKFDPKEIDFVILTHAHLDHSGLLPKLCKYGFTGKIYSPGPTYELCRVLLYDSAKIQEDYSRTSNKPGLYNTKDVENCLNRFVTIDFKNKIQLFNDIYFEFLPVGHVLGASSIHLLINGDSYIFSGDIGRVDQSIIKSVFAENFKNISPICIFMEALYGGVKRDPKIYDIEMLLDIIGETIANGGNVIIPVFALHRAQEILELLKYFFTHSLIKGKTKVYLDSPMASKITKIYNLNSYFFNDKDLVLSKKYGEIHDNDRFGFDALTICGRRSKNNMQNNSIILAGSGMADGGRVVQHLYRNLSSPQNTVIFIGFQAEGTLGRLLVDGHKKVKINNEEIDVKANIVYLRGFSAHADNDELINWINLFDLSKLERIFLIHGEDERLHIFKGVLSDMGLKAEIPSLGEEFLIK